MTYRIFLRWIKKENSWIFSMNFYFSSFWITNLNEYYQNIMKKQFIIAKSTAIICTIIFFCFIFFSIEISNSESVKYKYKCQMNNNFFINGNTENIFALLLLLVYYICNITPINFFMIFTYIVIEKWFWHNLSNIKFNTENEISIEKKIVQKKILFDNFTYFFSNSKFFTSKYFVYLFFFRF